MITTALVPSRSKPSLLLVNLSSSPCNLVYNSILCSHRFFIDISYTESYLDFLAFWGLHLCPNSGLFVYFASLVLTTSLYSTLLIFLIVYCPIIRPFQLLCFTRGSGGAFLICSFFFFNCSLIVSVFFSNTLVVIGTDPYLFFFLPCHHSPSQCRP